MIAVAGAVAAVVVAVCRNHDGWQSGCMPNGLTVRTEMINDCGGCETGGGAADAAVVVFAVGFVIVVCRRSAAVGILAAVSIAAAVHMIDMMDVSIAMRMMVMMMIVRRRRRCRRISRIGAAVVAAAWIRRTFLAV